MRLIDADELISRMGFVNTQAEREENVGEIVTLEMIDDISVAYDLEQVLEQLRGNTVEVELFGIYSEYVPLGRAIAIVKGGARWK